MHTRASNSEIGEPLPKPERTLNRRLHRRNRRVPYDQINNPPQHSRIVYPPILNINYFRHFFDILRNYDPMDDEPMWAADRVVASTPCSVITIPKIANEFAIKGNHLTLVKGNQFDGRTKINPHKHIHEFLGIYDMFKYRDTKNEAVRLMMFPLSLTGEAKTWLDELNERTIETWDELRTDFISRFFPLALFDRLLREVRAFSQHENESLTDAWLRSSNSDTNKIMARMDAMTMKIDAQYKELQSRSKQPTPNLDDDDMPMSHEEEAKLMQTFPENMLVEVGKFTFPVDFVILEMEEDKDFDALLDEGSKILYSIEGTLLEEEIFSEFDEFMAMTADENSKSDTEEPPFEKITINIDYKIKTSLEEPPTDLELKPLLDNLEYVFLEEPSFLPVIISPQLSTQNKGKLISVLKKRKEAFAWKTTDNPGIWPSFCKHKIQLLDDKKLVVQKQRRLNPNMQEVVKKEIVKLLDIGIIYPIADSS
ncbi:reverse transcriptase domain-containing protein [Tanacetum coccineum]